MSELIYDRMFVLFSIIGGGCLFGSVGFVSSRSNRRLFGSRVVW